MTQEAQVPRLTLGRFNDLPGLRHAFFTRAGGVSGGIYESLNCGPGSRDDPATVRANRARALAALDLPADALVTTHQVHSATALPVTAPWPADERPQGDALVTRRRGLALGVLTADCAPVLFVDPEAGVIGAAHAGWRGALDGVLDAALAAMEAEGAVRARILAGIGPCIGKRSYEVGPEFPAPFLGQDPDNGDFFAAAATRPGHFLFDLKGYVARRLARAGLAGVEVLPCDTYAEPARFFSHRRARHAGEADYGRLLSAIALMP